MADGMSFNFDEIDQLAADLGDVPSNVGPFLNSAIQFTSKEIKKSAAKKVRGRKNLGQAAQAIDYEITATPGIGGSVLESEIGYDKEKTAGPLGNLIEFGAPGSPNTLTPGNELLTALHENEADFEKGIRQALEDAEKKAGL